VTKAELGGLGTQRCCLIAFVDNYSAEDKEGGPRFKGFLDAPVKTKTITR